MTTRTKTIEYRCGCKIVVGDWTPDDTKPGIICLKHFKGIRRITTVVEYHNDVPV